MSHIMFVVARHAMSLHVNIGLRQIWHPRAARKKMRLPKHIFPASPVATGSLDAHHCWDPTEVFWPTTHSPICIHLWLGYISWIWEIKTSLTIKKKQWILAWKEPARSGFCFALTICTHFLLLKPGYIMVEPGYIKLQGYFWAMFWGKHREIPLQGSPRQLLLLGSQR